MNSIIVTRSNMLNSGPEGDSWNDGDSSTSKSIHKTFKGQILDSMIEAFKSKIENSLDYVKTNGFACCDLVTLSKDPGKTVLMDDNQITIYNSVDKSFQKLLEVEDQFTFEHSQGRFALSKDDKYLAYADSYVVAVLDL